MDTNDFSKLKYNLYTLLNIKEDSTIKQIKKSYKKLIIQFHPDKCSKLEEDIFYNITLAYQILSNDVQRYNYDNFLKNKHNQKSSYELKNDFNNNKNILKEYVPKTMKEAHIDYQEKIKYFENKHSINIQNFKETKSNLKKLKTSRDQLESIKKENFKNTGDFNSSFKLRKQTGEFNDQIIKINPNQKIVCYQETELQNNYASIHDYEKIYTEDTIQTNKYSSLDRAFLMHPEQEIPEEKKKDIKYGIDKYNKLTKDFNRLHDMKKRN